MQEQTLYNNTIKLLWVKKQNKLRKLQKVLLKLQVLLPLLEGGNLKNFGR